MEKVPEGVLLKPFFRIRENVFQSFCTKYLSLLNMRSLAYKISHCLSVNHNEELRCVTCTGVTLFALVLHLNCTALSQLESSNFFMCITIRLCTSRIEASTSPPPGQPPGNLIFWKIFVQIPPS